MPVDAVPTYEMVCRDAIIEHRGEFPSVGGGWGLTGGRDFFAMFSNLGIGPF